MVVVVFNRFTFSPNLFYSTDLFCPTYLMQAEKGGGVDQTESCKPSMPTKEHGPPSTTTTFALMLLVIVPLNRRAYHQTALYLLGAQKSL
jgi:hypothetical protein